MRTLTESNLTLSTLYYGYQLTHYLNVPPDEISEKEISILNNMQSVESDVLIFFQLTVNTKYSYIFNP